MITLPRGKDDELWNTYWSETKEEWFKVEVLQDYGGEDGGVSLEAWLNGDIKSSLKELDKIGSQTWVKEFKQAPFKKIRIHIVEKPYTPYLSWEIEHYKRINIPPAGENVYLVDKVQVSDLLIPNGDFIIFDQKRVTRNHYDRSGREYEMDFYEETDNIDSFLSLRKELLKIATPLTP